MEVLLVKYHKVLKFANVINWTRPLDSKQVTMRIYCDGCRRATPQREEDGLRVSKHTLIDKYMRE